MGRRKRINLILLIISGVATGLVTALLASWLSAFPTVSINPSLGLSCGRYDF